MNIDHRVVNPPHIHCSRARIQPGQPQGGDIARTNVLLSKSRMHNFSHFFLLPWVKKILLFPYAQPTFFLLIRIMSKTYFCKLNYNLFDKLQLVQKSISIYQIFNHDLSQTTFSCFFTVIDLDSFSIHNYAHCSTLSSFEMIGL